MNPGLNIVENAVTLPLGSDRELVERFRQGDPEAFKGLYSFTLEWIPEVPTSAGTDAVPLAGPGGPSLVDVLAQQLGLKLESKKLPIDFIVIDKAEKPTEN